MAQLARSLGQLLHGLVLLLLAMEAAFAKDYYSVLGVDRSADDATLKRAYRALARKWHPDKNPGKESEAEEQFREIQSAYDVLSDREKRKIYDKYGEDGVKQYEAGGDPGAQAGGPNGFGNTMFTGGPGGRTTFRFEFKGPGGGAGGADPFDIFEQFFGGSAGGAEFAGFGGSSGGMRGRQQQQQQRPQENLYGSRSPVVTLGQGKFPGHDARHIWLVEFYAPWCGHCRKAVGMVEDLAKRLSGVARVGGVNCEKESALCRSHSIESFPTFKLVAGGRPIDFSGGPNANDLINFVHENIPGEHISSLLRPEALDTFVSRQCARSSSGACAIVFTDELESSPHVKSVAFNLRGKLPVAEVRGANAMLSAKLDIKSFPTVAVVCNGQLDRRELHTSRTLLEKSELASILSEFKSPERCASVKSVKQDLPPLDPNVEYSKMRVSKLRQLLAEHNVSCSGCVEKADFLAEVYKLVQERVPSDSSAEL